jgi:hypothetical protein
MNASPPQGQQAPAPQTPPQPTTTQQQPPAAPTTAAATPTTTAPATGQTPTPAATTDDIVKAIALLTAMAAKSRPDADLATHLREAAAEKDDPWRKRRAAIKRRTAGWDDEFQSDPAGAWESLRQHFGKAGRNALLDEDRAQELASILCASPLQLYRRARALLQFNPGDRMALHNFTVAEAMGESFVETWGPIVEGLAVPLFPARPEHEDTNQKLLAQMASYSAVSGGGPARHPKLTIFARPLPIAGAGYKAPVEDGAVDLGIVENEFDNVGARLRAVTARLDALEAGPPRGRGRGGRGRGNGHQDPQQQHYQNQAPQQQQQHYYNQAPQQQQQYNQAPQQQQQYNQAPQYYNNGGQHGHYNGNGRGRGRGNGAGHGGTHYVRGRGEEPQGNEEGGAPTL